MQNGCDDIFEAKIAERNEKAKKLYRYVSDIARRLDEATAVGRTVSDLFSTNIEILRQKIRENCEKLLFFDPLNYGKKSLELLWRKGYYDTVSISRKFQENDAKSENYLFSHIACGIGHFHQIITRVQTELNIPLQELDYEPFHMDGDSEDIKNTTQKDEEVQFGRYILYQCLIYLGDLSRYQVEIFHNFEPSTAARYYLQAAHIDLCSGMPFNQLGNLYLDKNYNLDSVCYYIHCLSCPTPFDGAMGNLIKILEKQTQYCENINEAETYTQTEHIQNTVANFLSLIEIWYFSKNDTNVSQRCNTIAHNLKIAMDFIKSPIPDINTNYNDYVQAIEEENSSPSFLNGNLIHKIVQICLFTTSKMVEIDEQKAFACKAFTLALLLQLLQKLQKQLELIGFKNPALKYRSRNISINDIESIKPDVHIPPAEETVDNRLTEDHTSISSELPNEELSKEISEDESKKITNGDVKINAKKVAKRRRRRRIASSGSSDLSNADTNSSEGETEDELSGEEEMTDSTYKSDDDSESGDSFGDHTDTDDLAEQQNGKIAKPEELVQDNVTKVNEFKQNTFEKNNIEKEDSKIEDNNIRESDIQDFLLGDNFLPSIKLLLDWVLLEKELILSCGESGESLFQCVVDLLNILTFYFSPKRNGKFNNDCKILEYAIHIGKKLKLEYKKIPLPEDLSLRGTNICKYDKDAAEWQILDRYKPSVYEENIIRILNFIDFGNQIAKIVPRIRFNRSMKIFYLKKASSPKVNTKINHKRSREWHNSKKPHAEGAEGGLLRRLGRLWLTSQVRELERSGRAAAAAAPALLVLDAAAMHLHLRRVKQLLRTRKFVLLVPTVVLQELDDLKRERSTARDAIRWLEMQLRSGSRFLRAQRPGQAKPLPLLKYPRKAPSHVNNFIQILEFCNHYTAEEKQAQGGNGEPENHGKSTPLLILLVGNEPGAEGEQYKEFSLSGAAQSAGISVEYINDFCAKLKIAPKTGKKR